MIRNLRSLVYNKQFKKFDLWFKAKNFKHKKRVEFSPPQERHTSTLESCVMSFKTHPQPPPQREGELEVSLRKGGLWASKVSKPSKAFLDCHAVFAKTARNDGTPLSFWAFARKRKIHAFKAQLCTSNLWILRFAQYDKEFEQDKKIS